MEKRGGPEPGTPAVAQVQTKNATRRAAKIKSKPKGKRMKNGDQGQEKGPGKNGGTEGEVSVNWVPKSPGLER